MSPARFRVIHAGRRSYKSEIFGRRWVVGKAMESPDTSWFYGGPTYRQTKMICWKGIKLLSPRWAVNSISETELSIQYQNGSEVCLVGFDRRERFEGKEKWDGGVLDEYAHMEKAVWDETVEPALRDTKGPCNFIGKPAGRNHYFELSQYARGSGNPEWDDFCWFSADVLDPVEIDKAKDRLDERTFRQEYEGSFESYEGRAYIYYDSKVHRKVQSFNDRLPVCVSCDFNLDPCLWLIGQDVNGKISAQEEIRQRQTNIWAMCNILKDRLTARIGKEADKHLTIFYGDYEHGKTRSVSAVASSWTILQQEFAKWNVQWRVRPNPRVIDRINAVNSKLRTAKGTIQLEIDPMCIELHKDFEIVSMDMLQSPTQKNTMPDRTHASDALGYWINYDYPIVGRGAKLSEN